MATLIKVFTEKLTDEQLKQLDEVRVHRDFFLCGEIYGSTNATVKGEWKAVIATITITKDNETKTKRSWQVGFVPAEATEPIESLSKSFLLSVGTYDADNNRIIAVGSVREWAQKHIVSGKLEKDWCKELATLLNEKGLKVEQTEFPRLNKETKSRFTAKITHPYFAK